MKKRKLSILLSIITACSFLASCKGNVENGQGTSDTGIQVEDVQRYPYEGIHIMTATERSDYLVQNGKTQYKLVLPEVQDEYLRLAKNDFIFFFKQATGITMDVIVESGEGLAHSTTEKYISIGNTKMFQSANIDLKKDILESQGVRIFTKDNTIYVNGGAQGGALYAMYDLLQILFNYEIYAEDCWVIDENVKDLKMRDFDVVDVPDVEMRANFWGAITKNTENIAYRFRMPKEYYDALMPIGDVDSGEARHTIHNSTKVVSKKSEVAEDKWYSINGEQLCYTARGDVESYQRMVAQAAKVITRNLELSPPKDYPDFTYCALTMEDNFQNCTCEACAKAKQKYGEDSGAVLVFCNDVMELVSEWMEKPENAEYKRENFRLTFFAYHGFVDAPAHYDEATKTYVMNHPDLQLRDDVGVFLALSPGFNGAENIYHESNASARERCLEWFAVSKNLYMWTYNANFDTASGYLVFNSYFNLFNSDGYQFLANGNLAMLANQGQFDNPNYTAFQGIKPFLDYKLQWQSNLNSDELIDDWFKAMYKEAAPIMKQLFLEEQAHHYYMIRESGAYGKGNNQENPMNKDYWPINLLTRWLGLIEEAKSVVKEKYEVGNPALYKTLKKHIDMEWVSPAYFLLCYYDETNADPTLINAAKAYFKNDIAQLAPYQIGNHNGTLSNWLSNLS
ncbi:MAG: DUF4838 domain-containing protein [Clostridia bacterium]|nr:DUF4838 domain-containing protein [Clostridia bacterium]